MYFLILILGAGLPGLVLLSIFLKRDNQKKEPAGLIIGTFFRGILAIFPALILEGILSYLGRSIPPTMRNVFRAFLVAGLCEEMVKMSVVRRYAIGRAGFDEITDGIIYAITAGLGFAFYENLMYGLDSSHMMTLLILRGLTAVPLHALSSGIMGYYIGLSCFGNRDFYGRGLFWAVAVHGLYDFILFSPAIPNLLIIPLLAGLYPFLFHLMNRAKERDRELGLT